MIIILLKDYESLELSTQILIKASLDRKIKVEVLDWENNFIRISKGKRIEYIKQATRTSADNYIVPLIMENKHITKLILKEKGIKVPVGENVKSLENVHYLYTEFKNKDIVIKPNTTNFGQGVFILKNLNNIDILKKHLEKALNYDKSVLIEEFIAAKEYRFLVIGEKVVAVLHRLAANVLGNGLYSIEKLVKEKNKSPLRAKGYVTPLEKIILGEEEKAFLALDNKTIDYIPAKGERVFLRENSNISTGGDSIDYTDKIDDSYKEIAIKAVKAVGAKICGADIMIKDVKKAVTRDNYSIIELNFNPALHIHNYPYQGKNRDVANYILDLIGF